MTMLGRHLAESEQLRDGIELAEVRDVLWTYTAVELYERWSSSAAGPPTATPHGSGTR
jgi:hypothetical protein